MKINWLSKLSSRKFWAAVAGFVTAVLVAFNVSSLTVEQAAVIIAAMGGLASFILGESYVDGKREEAVKLGEIVADITAEMTDKIVDGLQDKHEEQDG